MKILNIVKAEIVDLKMLPESTLGKFIVQVKLKRWSGDSELASASVKKPYLFTLGQEVDSIIIRWEKKQKLFLLPSNWKSQLWISCFFLLTLLLTDSICWNLPQWEDEPVHKLVVASIMMFISYIIVQMIIGKIRASRKFSKTSVLTKGKIVSTKKKTDVDDIDFYYPIISFSGENGKKYEFTSAFALYSTQVKKFLNTELEVAYNPNIPYVFEVKNFHETRAKLSGLFFILAILLFMAIGIYISPESFVVTFGGVWNN